MTSTPDIAPPPRWRRIALAVCMFLITGVFGFLQPFVPLYLTSAGLSKSEYGLVSALGTGMILLIQPILGRLSDRYDARRPFMVASAVCAGIAYLAYPYASGLVLFTVLTAIGVNGFQYLNSVGGVLVGRLAAATGRAGGATYVRYRVWGSVGYIFIALGAGILVNPTMTQQATLSRADLEPLFRYGPLLFFVIGGVALVVPDLKRSALAAPSPPAPLTPPSPAARGRGAGGEGAPLANLNRFFLAYFLYQFSLYGASAYLPLYMKQLGAKPLWITGMFAAGVISEVLMMSQVGRWTDTYGRRPALAIAFLLMPLRLLLYIPATGPLWVLMVQTLHGINFGIIGTIAIVFVNDQANDTNRGTLQARLTMTAGIGLALGPLTCGWLTEKIGMGGMFAAMSAVGVLAAIVFLTQVRESHPAPEMPRGLLGKLAG
jgi:PPP family 3-phenylpropionic acid transporter